MKSRLITEIMNDLIHRFGFLVAVLLLSVSFSVRADSNTDLISAPEAFALAQAGQITLIDIRRPHEWRQTGIAQGVKTIDMVHPQGMSGFAQEVYQAVGGNLDAPIVLICRTGSRTSRLTPALRQMGFTHVRHVPEGMLGSRAGPGWIARGLPTEACTAC
jgi:rhodanese-related sulfurtransferase